MRLLIDNALAPSLAEGLRAFGTLLSASGASLPSVILLRRASQRHPDQQLRLLVLNLEAWRADLSSGAVVVIEDTRVRVRRLPMETVGNEG